MTLWDILPVCGMIAQGNPLPVVLVSVRSDLNEVSGMLLVVVAVRPSQAEVYGLSFYV